MRSYRPKLQVLIPPHTTVTGVGIGIEFDAPIQRINMTIWPLTPCCAFTLVYKDGTSPLVLCENCRKEFTSFPHLRHRLLHRGPLAQVFQTDYVGISSATEVEIETFIQNWTGLTDIGFSVTV